MKIRKIQRLVSVLGFVAAVIVIAGLKLDLPINGLIIETKFDWGEPWTVFYDIGKGYNNTDSQSQTIAVSTKLAFMGKIREREFTLPLQPLKSLRIQPGTQEADITIASITFVHQYHRLGYRETLYILDAAQIVKDFQPLRMIDRFTVADNVVQIHATGSEPLFDSVIDFSQVYAHLNTPALPLHKLILYFCAFLLAGLLFVADHVLAAIKRLHATSAIMLLWALTSLVIGFGIGSVLWEKIALPFHNPLEVVGPLARAHFNPNNNALRYLTFIALPTVVFLLGFALPAVRRNFLPPGPAAQGMLPDETSAQHAPWFGKILGCFSALLFLAAAVENFCAFFLVDFQPRQLDFFHDGEWLTPAYNYLTTGQLWQGSYFAHGVLYDPLSAYFGWKLFGQTTIGAANLAIALLTLLIPAAVVVLCLSLAGMVAKNDWPGKILLPQLCLLLYWLSSFGAYQELDRRDVPVLLGLACVAAAFAYHKPVFFFSAGLFSALSYFYSIDRGAYFSALLLLLLILMPLFRFTPARTLQRACWGALAGGIIGGWLVFIGCFGIEECKHFLANTLMLYRTKDLIDSYIYPTPKDPFSPYVLPMLMIGAQLLFFTLNFLQSYWRNIQRRSWGYVHVAFLLLAIFYFRSAIGLSNVWHIWYASTFAFIGLSFVLWELIGKLNNPALRLLVVVMLLVVNLSGISLDLPFNLPNKLTNLLSFKRRVSAYAQLADTAFLTKPAQAGIQRMQAIFADEQCAFVYTSEAALPYLLKKPSCGKNFIVWFCSPRPKQAEIIHDLSAAAPTYLVFLSNSGSNHTDGIWNAQRLPEVHKYILDRYARYEKVQDDWVIYKLKPEYAQK